MKKFNTMTEKQMVKVEGGIAGLLLLVGGTLLSGGVIAGASQK